MNRSLLFFLLCLTLAACAARQATPGDALERFRLASGADAWSAKLALQREGRLAAAGLDGRIALTEELPQGRSRSDYSLGSLRGAEGFDGERPWQLSPGGEIAIRDGENARRAAQTRAWVAGLGYGRVRPDDYREAMQEIDGRRFVHATATPPGGLPVALWFDADSGLLDRFQMDEGGVAATTYWSDYRRVEGVLLPFLIVSRSETPGSEVRVEIERAAFAPLPEASHFAPPSTRAGLNPIAGKGGRTEIPFDLLNNHIYLDARIDGQPVRLMLDTGGLNLLTHSAAERLGLASEGELQARGVGEKTAPVSMARASRLEVGGARLDDPLFYVMDFSEIQDIEGVDFDGLVGFELVQRYITEIDYPGRRLTLIERDAFLAPTGAVPVPIEFDERTPIAAGQIDGLPARFTIDTGSRNTLAVNAPFARQHALQQRYGASFEAVVGWGVGGATRGHPVRFDRLHLGDAEASEVLGNLSTAGAGALADADVSGNIGGGVLKRFVVTFDYEGRLMYLARSELDPPRENYDRFGAWLIRDGADALRVVALTEGGAAARAGVREGDRLLAIDGAAVATRTLPDWRDFLRNSAPGTPLRLELQRDGTPLKLDAVLTDLLP